MAAASSTVEMIIKYAAQGFKQAAIAGALGVDESYVSQVVNDPENAKKIEESAVAITVENEKHDNALDKIEDRALEIIDRKLHMGTDMKTALTVAVRVNAMKRRRDTAPATRAPTGTVVNLILPQVVTPRYVMNDTNELVEVEGRTMLSANPAQLESLAKTVFNRELKDVAKPTLPAPKEQRAEVLLQQLETTRKPRARNKPMDISDIA